MSMSSEIRNQSKNPLLLAFEESWCRIVFEKAEREAKKEREEKIKGKADSTSSKGFSQILPDFCQFKQLLSILFYASFETEEGVYPQISVIWLPSCNPECEFGSGRTGYLTETNRKIQFEEPRRINDKNKRDNTGQLALPSKDLRKLAALCDSEEILLLVEPNGNGDGGLVAWGLLDIRHTLTTEASSPGDLLELSTYPSALSVHFDRPGSLVVKWGGKYLKEFPGNDEPVPIAGLKLFKTRCEESRSDNIGGIVNLDHKPIGYSTIESNQWTWHSLYEHAQILVVESMLGNLVKRKMGGTFLFVPDESDDDDSERGELNIRPGSGVLICQSQSINNEIKGWIDSNRVKKCSIDHIFAEGSVRYRLRMVADWLANFATVDGSVILSRDLRLLAFAAKTEVKQKQKRANSVGAATKEPIDDLTRDWLKSHGTRHNSAANWVGADSNGPCKPSLGRFALVISQDGHASAFYWKCGEVHRSAVVYRCL